MRTCDIDSDAAVLNVRVTTQTHLLTHKGTKKINILGQFAIDSSQNYLAHTHKTHISPSVEMFPFAVCFRFGFT